MTCWIGLDVAKAVLDGVVRPTGEVVQFANDAARGEGPGDRASGHPSRARQGRFGPLAGGPRAHGEDRRRLRRPHQTIGICGRIAPSAMIARQWINIHRELMS